MGRGKTGSALGWGRGWHWDGTGWCQYCRGDEIGTRLGSEWGAGLEQDHERV